MARLEGRGKVFNRGGVPINGVGSPVNERLKMSAYYGKGIQVKQHIIEESGLVGKGITLRIRGISFQTSLAA